jgi:uncharacterized protein (DUF1778 family)
MAGDRTSFIIRCSQEEAAMIRSQAATERRSVSACLLNILDRSLWIEEHYAAGLTGSFVPPPLRGGTAGGTVSKTAIQLYCSVEELARIRQAAVQRCLSINRFILFSLRRHWRAVENLRGTGDSAIPDR